MSKISKKILSVITVNLNDCKGLERTVESVKNQSNKDFEHIVIDGGSTDGSLNFIEQNKIHFSYWISEPDNGVYDAQNKGIQKANGGYLMFLNSGDTFYSNNVIEKFHDFEKNKSAQIIYANSNVTDPKGKISILKPPGKLELSFWYRNTINHQAVFFNKEVFERFGSYNNNYKFCADFELLLKVFLAIPDMFCYFNEMVCNYSETGLSAQPVNYEKVIQEKELILKRLLSTSQYDLIKSSYRKALPFKQRLLLSIYDKPLLSKLFKSIYRPG